MISNIRKLQATAFFVEHKTRRCGFGVGELQGHPRAIPGCSSDGDVLTGRSAPHEVIRPPTLAHRFLSELVPRRGEDFSR
jgi:hypothetical protein